MRLNLKSRHENYYLIDYEDNSPLPEGTSYFRVNYDELGNVYSVTGLVSDEEGKLPFKETNQNKLEEILTLIKENNK